MVNINFYGDIFSQTGYASHCRQFLASLYKLNPQIHLETQLPPDWVRWCSTAEMNMIQSQPFTNTVDVVINLPPFYPLVWSNKPKHFVGWVVWEGTNIPMYWIDILNNKNISYIITPSQHTKNAIINTLKTHGTTLLNPQIYVIPHGVNTSLFKPKTIQKSSDSPFVFVADKGWAQGINDRGGIQWLLKAFCEEFTDKDNVELIIKINTIYCLPGWNLPNELAKIGIQPNQINKVKFIVQNTDYNNLINVYQQGDVFVSPTMGDAFNLGCIQAMACGLPILSTSFGGQCDYIENYKNGILIDYKLIDVTWDIMYEGNQWALPNIEDLKKKMRWCYENKDEIKKMGINALNTSKNYTWESSAKQLLNLINEQNE